MAEKRKYRENKRVTIEKSLGKHAKLRTERVMRENKNKWHWKYKNID